MRRGRRSATSVLDRAVARWDARAYDGKLDALLDLSGNGLHARLGSAVGADTNDPLRLLYAGRKTVYFPGVSLNQLTLSTAAWAGATEFEAILDYNPIDWAAAGRNCFFGAYGGTDQFILSTLSTNFRLELYPAGSATSAAIPAEFINGTARQLRVTWASSGGAVNWYHRTGETDAWVLFKTSSGYSSGTALGTGTATLRVGDYNSAGLIPYNGYFNSLRLRTSIGGADVVSLYAADLAEPYATHVDRAGNSWTFNRSATGRKLAVVDRDLLLLGTDDYLEVADSPLLNFGISQNFTVAWLGRTYGSLASQWRIAKKVDSAVLAGYGIRAATGTPTSSQFIYADGSVGNADTQVNVPASGVLQLLSGRRLNEQAWHYTDGVTTGPTGSLNTSCVNSEVLRIGRGSGATTQYGDFEFIGAAIFREALTADELVRLKGEMLR